VGLSRPVVGDSTALSGSCFREESGQDVSAELTGRKVRRTGAVVAALPRRVIGGQHSDPTGNCGLT